MSKSLKERYREYQNTRKAKLKKQKKKLKMEIIKSR